MNTSPTTLITGAAGNLGGFLARYLHMAGQDLRLMVHHKSLPRDLERALNVTTVRADLANPSTLPAAVDGVDVVVHFAGVLFKPRPESFLPVTNTLWFSNLLDACLEARVARVILISFPHVEGPTTPESPAVGRLDGNPVSVHARTRLAQERMLMERTRDSDTSPVVLRLGMVYGRGVLMIDAARWLARHRLLGVWRDPTWVHLLSTDDFLTATQAAILKPDVHGIYHVGDEEPISLQHFLDEACRAWRLPKPMRMPVWTIYAAAWCCEAFGMIARKPSPLTRDFVRIGRVSHVGDTRRAREELIPVLRHPSLESGVHTL